MGGFSTIITTPEVRAIVDDKVLEKQFFSGLYPRNLFRKEATASAFGEKAGDMRSFTGEGLLPVAARPVKPGDDSKVGDYTREQWTTRLQMYAFSKDTHLPTRALAAADTLARDIVAIGRNAGQTMNRVARNILFRAGLSGWTVANGAQNAVTTLRVMFLNGLTRARNPNTAGASVVAFEPVSAANPLSVQIFDTAGPAFVTRTITGFTPDNAGDEWGPGTITLTGGAVTVLDRAVVKTVDRTSITRVGTGDSVDALGSGDKLTLADLRTCMITMENDEVPQFGDGTIRLHLDPTMKGQLFSDTEFQRLHDGTALTPGLAYSEFMVSRAMGFSIFQNTELPQVKNVGKATGASADFTLDDPFPGELTANGLSTGVQVHRALALGDGGFFEYYADDPMITEAGLNGIVKSAGQINSEGIDLAVDRLLVFMRPPQSRIQTEVSTTWRAIMDFCVRTDAATGGASRYKRVHVIEAGS